MNVIGGPARRSHHGVRGRATAQATRRLTGCEPSNGSATMLIEVREVLGVGLRAVISRQVEERPERAHVAIEAILLVVGERADRALVPADRGPDQRGDDPHEQVDLVGGVARLTRDVVGGGVAGDRRVTPRHAPGGGVGLFGRAEGDRVDRVERPLQPSERRFREAAVLHHPQPHPRVGDLQHRGGGTVQQDRRGGGRPSTSRCPPRKPAAAAVTAAARRGSHEVSLARGPRGNSMSAESWEGIGRPEIR